MQSLYGLEHLNNISMVKTVLIWSCIFFALIYLTPYKTDF